VLRDFSRTNPLLVIKGGVLGDRIMDARETTALADLPSREVLLARLAGALAAPMQQLAGLLQALPRNMAYGLAALRDQRAAGGGVEGGAVESAATREATASSEATATSEATASNEPTATTEATPTEAASPSHSGAAAEASSDASAGSAVEAPEASASDSGTPPSES
jgi:large subunit ribosomal protein L10